MLMSPLDSEAMMAALRTTRLEGQGGNTTTMQGQKVSLRQRVQELRAVIALQEQGKKFFFQSCEEKLSKNGELFARLREAVKEKVNALAIVQKVAHEEIQCEIYSRVNKSNMLLYWVRQRSQARDKLQRWLKRLQDAKMQHQSQRIRQLENSIAKMLMKVESSQKVTTLYLAVQDILKKELYHLPLHLDLLCRTSTLYHGELEDMELTALEALKGADVTKEDMAKMETQFLTDREFRYQSLAARKVLTDRRWLKEASRKSKQGRYELGADSPTPDLQEALVDTNTDATKSQTDFEAWVTEKMEKAKAVLECSHIWDTPSRLRKQQKSSGVLGQFIRELKEKQKMLKETLKELELKKAELKFHQPPSTTRMLEEELRMNQQREEARLEQVRAQVLRSNKFLLKFENGINNLFTRLRGITIPDQDDSAKASGLEEKLQHCKQKLQYLAQQVADLNPDSRSPDENNESLAEIKHLLEKTIANDPQNLKISLEDPEGSIQEPFDFADKDHGLVLTRENIKHQGLQLIERKKKRGKKS